VIIRARPRPQNLRSTLNNMCKVGGDIFLKKPNLLMLFKACDHSHNQLQPALARRGETFFPEDKVTYATRSLGSTVPARSPQTFAQCQPTRATWRETFFQRTKLPKPPKPSAHKNKRTRQNRKKRETKNKPDTASIYIKHKVNSFHLKRASFITKTT